MLRDTLNDFVSCFAAFTLVWVAGRPIVCYTVGTDGHKSTGTDPAEENTSNTSRRNPQKDDSTIPEGSTLVGSTHTSQDIILLQ